MSQVRRISIAILSLLATVRFPPSARAEGASPVQISLFPPVQIVSASRPVSGVRLDLIYGKNTNVTGLDWGLVNHTTGVESAWQSGFVNLDEKDFIGLQSGIVNLTQGTFTGFQDGGFNQTEDMNGVALGWVNVSKHMHGVQLGLINVTETLHGLQIGVANVIHKNKVPFLPIVNWSF